MISSLMNKLYPPTEYRILLLGNDSSGKTSLMYKWVLGELITTVPTLGFNLEKISRGRSEIAIWDVGGCDRIRPLWKHYFHGTDLLVFMISASDTTRMRLSAEKRHGNYLDLVYADSSLREVLQLEEVKDAGILILISKTDLCSTGEALSVEEVIDTVGLHQLMAEDELRYGRTRQHRIMGCSIPLDEGIEEAMDWIVHTLQNPSMSAASRSNAGDDGNGEATRDSAERGKESQKEHNLDKVFQEWIAREDDPDDIFLGRLHDATLDVWDHYTHLRIAWLHLTRFGRREGMQRIFESIKSFIERSPITQRIDTSRGTTFHETMTYFWTHMVHYAMKSTKNLNGNP